MGADVLDRSDAYPARARRPLGGKESTDREAKEK